MQVGANVRQNDRLGEIKPMLQLSTTFFCSTTQKKKKGLKAPLPRNKKSFEYKSELGDEVLHKLLSVEPVLAIRRPFFNVVHGEASTSSYSLYSLIGFLAFNGFPSPLPHLAVFTERSRGAKVGGLRSVASLL